MKVIYIIYIYIKTYPITNFSHQCGRGIRKSQIDQWSRINNLEIDLGIHKNLILYNKCNE